MTALNNNAAPAKPNNTPDSARPPKIKERVKGFLKKHLFYVVLAIIVVANIIIPKVVSMADDSVRPAIAKQMVTESKEWAKVEKDGSALIADLNAGNVKAIGIGASAVLVTTRKDENYFVVDGRGAFAALTVEAAKESSTKNAFELVVLHALTVGAAAQPLGFFGVLEIIFSMLVPVLLIGLLIFSSSEKARNLFTGAAFKVEKFEQIKFNDVIGASEAKAAFNDIQMHLKEPETLTKLGGRAPCGVLLLGGPGVGKTMLAKALAGETGANFIAANGSDFSSKYFGAGIQKVKSLFKTAREHAPCIIFIDEIDGIGKRTNGGSGPTENESNRIINQVLVEMDGFEDNSGIIVIGATNLTSNLDEALLREGRFDRRITVKNPDVRDREAILRLYAEKVKVEGPVDFLQLSRLTVGLSPAALAHIVNQAAGLAARAKDTSVGMSHFLESIETSRMGARTGSERALTEVERRRIACHESGHALASVVLNNGNVEKATIMPRGDAHGVTLVTDSEDKTLHLESDLRARIKVLLAGRNAELTTHQEASTGASHDLQEASRIALDMVSRLGFGLERKLFSVGALSPQAAAVNLKESISDANSLLTMLDQECQALLREYRPALEQMTAELLEQETISGDRIREIVATAPKAVELLAA